MAGRPTLCTADLAARLADLIACGAYPVVACRRVGIDKSSYARWMQRGERDLRLKDDSTYARFRTAIKESEAQAEIDHVACLRKAAQTNWIAVMTLLERRWPTRWGLQDRLEIEDARPALPPVDLSKLSAPELIQLKALLRKALHAETTYSELPIRAW